MIVACGQMTATTIDQAAAAWPAIERLAKQAGGARVDLLVLPETAYPAYWLESAERYLQTDIERSAAVLERLARIAANHRMWLVAGFVEEAEGKLFNSAAVFDRAGKLIGVARKNFLWGCDHQWFTPGRALSVFNAEFGRLGVLICADARVPEIPATLARDGAELIVQPTAWVNTSKVRRTYRNIQPDFLIRARAMEFNVPFVCCSKSGREGTVLEYVGQSQIVSANGQVRTQAAPGGEELIAAEITPNPPRPARINPPQLERLLSGAPAHTAVQPTGMCRVEVKLSADAVESAMKAVGARVVRLPIGDLAGFAAARCAALDGAQVLVAEGRVADDTAARARAAENRVFVIIASHAVWKVIDPDGTVAWRQGDGSDAAHIDLAQADLKQFTPETDLWSQRRVECYRLAD